MKLNKIFFGTLVIIWMITVFVFSHQQADDSSATSGNTIRFIINHMPIIKDIESTQKESLIETMQPIVRKIAHLSIYTVGGLFLYCFVNTYNIEEKNKIYISTLAGVIYAIMDEIHQLFIPRKSRDDSRRNN